MIVDGETALKLVGREERRRTRADEKARDAEQRRFLSRKRKADRAQAYKDRHDSNVTKGKRRPSPVGVYWTEKGISKLHRYSTRGMIMKVIRGRVEAGVVVKVDDLENWCAGFLYGDAIRPHLVRLEEAAHIEYVFKL